MLKDFQISDQRKISSEVLHATERSFALNAESIKNLMAVAKTTKRLRSRLCVHSSIDERVHQMFIVHNRTAYVRPHAHIGKAEAMLVLQGSADYLVFSDKGIIEEVVPLTDFLGGKNFFLTVEAGKPHGLIIRSEWLVFLEITEGPFKKEDTLFPQWSPMEEDRVAVNNFMSDINEKVADLRAPC